MSLKPKPKKKKKRNKGQQAMDEENFALMKQTLGLQFASYGDDAGKQRMFAEGREHTKNSQQLMKEYRAEVKSREERRRKARAKKLKRRTQ